MLKNKGAAGLLTALMALQAVPVAYASPASDVGKITVREAPPPSPEDLALSAVNSRYKQEKNMGKINISNDIIGEAVRKSKHKPDSEEIVRIKRQLAEAIEACNDQYFDKALIIMEHLHAEHPESRSIQKWLGVYQNWAGHYEDSQDTLEQYRVSYPLNSEEANNDFMLAYYEVDNARHLGEAVSAKELDALQALAEKQDVFLVGEMNYREMTKTLVAYQKFMVETNKGATLTPTDSKALDDLWKQIPKVKRAHLDNYYGYNIDELTPIYADFYHRKDLNDAYAARKQKYEQHIAAAEIKEKAKSPENAVLAMAGIEGETAVPEVDE